MLKAKHILPGLFLALMVFSLAPADTMAQGSKIGFVQDEEIKLKYEAWPRAEEQFNTERNAWNEEAMSMQQELQDLVEEYEKQKLILSEEKRSEREAMIRTKEQALDAFTRTIFGPQGTAERKQAELFNPLLEAVSLAIETVAIEEDFDVIFTMQSGLGYIKPELDVTEKVLEALEKQE